jgi:hypothetical protein
LLGQVTAYQVAELKFVSADLWILDGFGKFPIKKLRPLPGTTGGPDHKIGASERCQDAPG